MRLWEPKSPSVHSPRCSPCTLRTCNSYTTAPLHRPIFPPDYTGAAATARLNQANCQRCFVIKWEEGLLPVSISYPQGFLSASLVQPCSLSLVQCLLHSARAPLPLSAFISIATCHPCSERWGAQFNISSFHKQSRSLGLLRVLDTLYWWGDWLITASHTKFFVLAWGFSFPNSDTIIRF